MYKYGRLSVMLSCMLLCFGKINETRAAGDCVEAAKNMKLVSVNYNNGVLGLDNTKTTAQVGKICGDAHAAGCFKFSVKYEESTNVKFADIHGHRCVIPHITVDYDFTGSTVYLTGEYKACPTRAVMRHELQHFTIWRTAAAQMISEVGNGLKNLALQYVERCSDVPKCGVDLHKSAWSYTQKISDKWQQIAEMNNNRLDQIDHQGKSEFAYRACLSWPY